LDFNDSSTVGTGQDSLTPIYYGVNLDLDITGDIDLVSVGSRTVYGIYSNITSTGTDINSSSLRYSYGGYFSTTGSDEGSLSVSCGIYATASGAQKNYSGYFYLSSTTNAENYAGYFYINSNLYDGTHTGIAVEAVGGSTGGDPRYLIGVNIDLEDTGNTVGNKDSYGIKSNVSMSGTATGGSVRQLYSGYFSATGSSDGTSTAIGIYAAAQSADTNWAGYFVGNIGVANGTFTSPSLTFTGDPNTGIYWIEADSIGISTGGTNAVTIGASQNVLIATTDLISGQLARVQVKGYDTTGGGTEE
jgi:hypothetical protein